jgi:hypothetical protein
MAQKEKKGGGVKPSPSEKSTCAPSSSGASQTSSAAMSSSETIQLRLKTIKQTQPEEDKSDNASDASDASDAPSSPGGPIVTESDATTYNDNGNRKRQNRGPKLRARDEKKLLKFQQEKGYITRDWSTSEEIATARARNLEAAVGDAGPEGKAAYNEHLRQAKSEGMHENPGEKVVYCLTYDHSLAPKDTQDKKYIVSIDGEKYCNLCKKFLGGAHLGSAEHVRRVEENAAGNMMGGETTSLRRHNDGKGFEGKLTKRGMMDYWGDALLNLPQAAKDRHKTKNIVLRIKKGRSLVIEPVHVLAFEIAAVSYNGCGKYVGQTLRPFVDIEDDDIVAIEAEGSTKALIESEDDVKLNEAKKELCPYPPTGQTWWPVTSVRLTNEAKMLISGWTDDWVVVVCWYQWLETPIEGWIIVSRL